MRYPWEMQRLTVEIWSDIACPWCWVGKRHLEAAIEELEERLFRAYLHQGCSMADHDVLCEVAADVELDAREARAVLTSDAV